MHALHSIYKLPPTSDLIKHYFILFTSSTLYTTNITTQDIYIYLDLFK